MAIYSQMEENEWLTAEKMAVRIHLPYNHVSPYEMRQIVFALFPYNSVVILVGVSTSGLPQKNKAEGIFFCETLKF